MKETYFDYFKKVPEQWATELQHHDKLLLPRSFNPHQRSLVSAQDSIFLSFTRVLIDLQLADWYEGED